ncbi:MAG TPA: hypothetical protein VGF13_12950 [Verrucomicrobiae bacterium]|jgi:hypothetical protein
MNASRYTKAPGRGWTWAGPSRVWLGDDHVLLVRSRIFFESYRRFFFNDIQGATVRRTDIGKMWNAIWALFILLFTLLSLAFESVGMIVMLSLAVPFVIALIVNIALGPTCTFHIRTAVQTERVPALSRVSAAKKFIARIEPLIAAAQGAQPGEELMAELAATQDEAANVPPVLGP